MVSRIGVVLALACVAGTAAAQEPLKLKASAYTPPAHYLTQFWSGVVKEMNAAAAGKASVELYHSEALGKSREQLDVVREGLADMSFQVSAIFYPAKYPLSMFVELPFFSKDIETSTKVIEELVRRKLITSEFTEVRLLAAYNTPPAQLFSNKPLMRLEDFKGLRVVGQGPVWTSTWSLLGAQGIAMGWPDIYLALERGTIDAAPGNWAASRGWKWAEVAKQPVEIGIMGGFFNAAVVNHQSWKKVPTDVQVKWISILNGTPARIAKLANENEEVGRQFAREKGRQIAVFPAAERERVAEKLVPIWQDWMDRNEKARKPAREIYRAYMEVMKKAGEPVVVKLPAS
jgi:TRAP-type C4-dicarboxylate transport system substrate-binding protein